MLLMVISSFILGLSYPLADKLIGNINGLEFAFFFLLITSVIQLPFVLLRWKEIRQMTFKGHFVSIILAGIVGTFLYWCEFASLKVGLPIAHMTFITLTVPAWTLFYEYFFGENTGHNLNKWSLAVLGSIVLVFSQSEFNLYYLMPVMTSFLMATWLIFSKRCQDVGISPILNSFFNDVFSLMGITFFLVLKGQAQTMSLPPNLINMILYAILIGLIPGLLFLYGLKKMELVPAATVMVLEPLLTGIVSIIATGEAISPHLVIGAFLIASSSLPDYVFSEIRRIAIISTSALFR